uniref:Uncharacterized protein n=1 Tax=Oryza sativa subsp. japonica TaxID=39947 RepID=Q6Z0U2_ORYSJ|nr:hypothetical protein [Oryza sativa Japonica Group]BAD05641.1 hypothetical protein [Oryza sativa Japonica Group]
MASLTVADRGRRRQGKEMRRSAMDEREAASIEEGSGCTRRHADGSRRSPPSPTRSAEAEGPPSSGVHGKKPAGGTVVGKAVGGEADVDERGGHLAFQAEKPTRSLGTWRMATAAKEIRWPVVEVPGRFGQEGEVTIL